MQSDDNPQMESNTGLLGFLDEADTLAESDEARQQVECATVAFRDLEKLMKNIGLYGRDHQSTDRFIEKTFLSLQESIQISGSMDLVVRPYEISLHGHAIMENPSPERNFIYTLYLDGVRRLRLLPEITQDEVARFVGVLLTDWDEPRLFEDDMVTLLWSSHFQGIKYSVLDNFAEDTSDDDENVYTVAGVVDRVRQRGQFGRETTASLTEDGSSRRLRRIDLSGAELTDSDLEVFREVIFEMDEREFGHLRTTVHTTAREKLEKFIEILFKVHLIQEVSEEARRGRITELFDRIADLLLDSGSIGELERLLRTIRRLTGPEDRIIRENVLAIEHIVEHWSAQPFIDRVTLGLRQPNFSYRPSVLGICQLLSRRAAPHIARVAGRIEDQETRALLWGLVEHKISGQEHPVADLLADADRQHAHEILKLFKRVLDPDDLKYAIDVGFKNLDPTVRLEALSNLPLADVERYQATLLRGVKDKSKSVRSRVLHMLARLRKKTVHERIVGSMDSKAFADYDLDEKRRFYAAAALTGGGADRWIEQFKANALLSTKGQDAVRHCAAIALGILLHRDALVMLEKEAKRRLKYPLAAEGAVWAIQHMNCTREERTRQLYDLFYHGTLSGQETRGEFSDD